jgi:2-(1,2-epoxy-1,2-dihydrophenyl)acetyl-CoA isomerase
MRVSIDGPTMTITLTRPDQLNCWDMTFNDELFDALESAMDDAHVRFIVFRGTGRAFCTGGDLSEFQQGIDEDAARYISAIVRKSHEIVLQVRKIGKLVIGAVNGLAAGSGFNLALACDIKIAARSARFSQRFVRVGLSPDTGGTFFLPQIVGFAKASELLLTGDFIDADEALRLGIVNQVVDDGDLDMATAAWIERLSAGAFQAQIHAKRLINQSCLPSLAVQLDSERDAMTSTARSRDFKEGVAAFLEKRRAQFSGE